MRDPARFNSGLSLSQARKDAKALAKKNGIKLSEAQNIIAIEHTGMKWSKAIKSLASRQLIPTSDVTSAFTFTGSTETSTLQLDHASLTFQRNRLLGLIVGSPGAGKSVLALEFIRQHLNNSLPVIYMPGVSESSFIESANRSKPVKTALALHTSSSDKFSILYGRNNRTLSEGSFAKNTLLVIDEYWLQLPIVPESIVWEKLRISNSQMILVGQRVEDFSEYDSSHLSFCVFGKSASHDLGALNSHLGIIENSRIRFIATDGNQSKFLIEVNDA